MRRIISWSWLLLLIVAVGYPAAQQRNEGAQLRTLTGQVFSSENQPLTKAIVYLKNTKTLAIKTYITETDGSYRFPALSPAVGYEVYAEYQGARSDTKTLSEFDSRKEPKISLVIKGKQ
jgi:hypothetical protein